jgi:hypothetical protein
MKYIEKFNLDKSLKDFFEGFNTPVDIKWIDKPNELIGLFSVNDKVYQITCKEKEDKIWTYKFYNYNIEKNKLDIELTNFNTGYMSVLSTIRIGMEYLIDKKNPKALIFGATDNSKGRKSLYDRFSKELCENYQFKFSSSEFKDKRVFVIHKELNKEFLFKVVQDVIEELFNEN